jgi:hypothetical protein
MKYGTAAVFMILMFFNGGKMPTAASYFGQHDAFVITPTGCNAADNVPVPETTDVFVGRQFFKRDGSLTTIEEGCHNDEDILEAIHSSRWGLVLERLDWETKSFSVIKPLVKPSAVIMGGPINGAIIRAAYDPDMVIYHGNYLITFECLISNGQNYKIDGTSACLGYYDDKTQQVDLERLHVVVSGKHSDDKQIFHSASVPQLLTFEDHLLLYWSEVTVEHGTFTRIGVRGARLEADKTGFYWIKGMGRMAYSTDPSTIEVWAPDVRNPFSDTAVDIKSLWVHGSEVIALVGLGGGGCAAPGPQPGCFRMALAKTSEALGDHIFNRSPPLDEAELPTNPQGYTRPIRNPDGGYSLIGSFAKPTENGYSEARPVPADWAHLGRYHNVVFPFPDTRLWPTE